MKVREIIKKIEEDFPLNSAMGFDNSGANVVTLDSDVNSVVVCLDVTMDAIEFAKDNGASMIITHHPMIFNEIKNINDDPVSKRVKLLNKYDISAYSCHTNFDVNLENGMGKNLLKKIFKNIDYELIGNVDTFIVDNNKYALGEIVSLKQEESFDSILNKVISNLELDENKIAYYNFNDKINKVIVIPGSGSGDIDLVIKNKPDLLITSDLKHNNILDLREEHISFINATHYGLEKVFVDSFSEYLAKNFNNIKILKYNINL